MRNPKKVIYASSADRGLNTLLGLWPDVLKAVPDAELVWAYGWDSFTKMHRGNPEQMKWRWHMARKMADVGCKELGRLSHEDLAKEFMSSGVWFYPTDFPEISCLTAMKAQAAKCKIVTSGYAALQETILQDEEEIEDIHLKPDKLKEIKQRLIKALTEPRDEEALEDTKKKVIEKYAWSNIAKGWDEVFRTHEKV